VIDLSVPFDSRPEYVQMAAYLHTALMYVGIGHVTAAGGRYSNNRTSFGLGAHKSCQKIGRAGAGTCHHHGGFSGNTGVGVTGMGCGCFMPGHDELDAQLVSQAFDGFDDHHVGSVGNGIDILDTLCMKAFQQQFSTSDLGHWFLLFGLEKISKEHLFLGFIVFIVFVVLLPAKKIVLVTQRTQETQ
jgi:hypothetical protein